jgi:hypothetical protein
MIGCAHDGWIGKENCNFNAFGMEIFRNIAPVSPGKALEAIERAANGDEGSRFTSRDHTHFSEFVWLLRHLAYDPELFDRSVNLMCRYALSEKPRRIITPHEMLSNLFSLFTCLALMPQLKQNKIIEELVDSKIQDKQELGLSFWTALEAWHFSSSHEFGFGAGQRLWLPARTQGTYPLV